MLKIEFNNFIPAYLQHSIANIYAGYFIGL